MRVELDEQVLGFLQEKGAADITLDVEDLPSSCCLGRVPEMKITFHSPQTPDAYRHFTVQGVRLHLSKLLRTQDTLTLFLTGMGPFKKLEVVGINLIL